MYVSASQLYFPLGVIILKFVLIVQTADVIHLLYLPKIEYP